MKPFLHGAWEFRPLEVMKHSGYSDRNLRSSLKLLQQVCGRPGMLWLLSGQDNTCRGLRCSAPSLRESTVSLEGESVQAGSLDENIRWGLKHTSRVLVVLSKSYYGEETYWEKTASLNQKWILLDVSAQEGQSRGLHSTLVRISQITKAKTKK